MCDFGSLYSYLNKQNIPGYTGHIHNFKTTSVSHYDEQGRPCTTTAAFHKQANFHFIFFSFFTFFQVSVSYFIRLIKTNAVSWFRNASLSTSNATVIVVQLWTHYIVITNKRQHNATTQERQYFECLIRHFCFCFCSFTILLYFHRPLLAHVCVFSLSSYIIFVFLFIFTFLFLHYICKRKSFIQLQIYNEIIKENKMSFIDLISVELCFSHHLVASHHIT